MVRGLNGILPIANGPASCSGAIASADQLQNCRAFCSRPLDSHYSSRNPAHYSTYCRVAAGRAARPLAVGPTNGPGLMQRSDCPRWPASELPHLLQPPTRLSLQFQESGRLFDWRGGERLSGTFQACCRPSKLHITQWMGYELTINRSGCNGYTRVLPFGKHLRRCGKSMVSLGKKQSVVGSETGFLISPNGHSNKRNNDKPLNFQWIQWYYD